jgi:hypothetical protein
VQRISAACGLAVLCGIVALAAYHPLYAVDFFWHLELGEVIARTHTIPATNLFSAAEPARAYVQFNWLWELGAAEVVRTLGFRGIRVLQAVLMAGSIAALFALARVHTKRSELAFVVAALGFVWFEDRFQERPASLVLIFMIASTALVLHWRSSGLGALALLAALGVLWSNLHGGESLLLPLTLFALWVGELTNRYLFDRENTRERAALLGLCVATFSLFASPTFLQGLTSWLSTIGEQVNAGNEEWLPAYTMLAQGPRPAFAIIALGPTVVAIAYGVEQAWRYRRTGEAALDASELCLCAGYLVLAHQAVRNVVLAIVPVLFMLGRVSASPSRPNRTAFALAAAALIAIATEDALVYSYANGLPIAEVMQFDLTPDVFPELATDFAKEAKLRGSVVNDGHWGGYLVYRLWPDCHVFADSRHHFTPEMWQVFRATHDSLLRAAGLDSAFVRYGTELTFFRGPTFPLGVPPTYRLLYKAGDQEIYQDLRGKHARENLERTRSWLARQGVPVASDAGAPETPELARKLGAERYLGSKYRQLITANATRDLRSSDAAVRGNARGVLAGQLYRAGEYAGARRELELALRELPNDPALRYLAAQNMFASGDYAAAQPQLGALLRDPTALAPRQQRRIAAMREVAQKRALAPRAAAP